MGRKYNKPEIKKGIEEADKVLSKFIKDKDKSSGKLFDKDTFKTPFKKDDE